MKVKTVNTAHLYPQETLLLRSVQRSRVFILVICFIFLRIMFMKNKSTVYYFLQINIQTMAKVLGIFFLGCSCWKGGVWCLGGFCWGVSGIRCLEVWGADCSPLATGVLFHEAGHICAGFAAQ